jgi:hypothetical protein
MNTPSKKPARRTRAKPEDTQIVGFRLPQAMAREVKTEASHRGVLLKDLFVELWEQYKRQRKDERN